MFIMNLRFRHGCILFWAFALFHAGIAAAHAATASGGFESVKQGQELASRIRSQRPLPEATASLIVRDSKGMRRVMDVRLRVVEDSEEAWRVIYSATPRQLNFATTTNALERLTVLHQRDQAPRFRLETVAGDPGVTNTVELIGAAAEIRFAGSDFHLSDLAMDFLYWPEQRFLRHEIKKSRSCRVLESINPEVSGTGLARVVSWADVETGNLLRAEAFDSRGKRARDFTVSKVSKVNGRWQLREIRIYDYRTDSTTTLEFELDVPAE